MTRPQPSLRRALTGPGLRARIVRPFFAVATLALVLAVAIVGVTLDRILTTATADSLATTTQHIVDDLHASQPLGHTLEGHRREGLIVQLLQDGAPYAQSRLANTVKLIDSPPPTDSIQTSHAFIDDASHLGPYLVAQTRTRAYGHTYDVAVATPLKASGDIIDKAILALSATAVTLLIAATFAIRRAVSRALQPVESIRSDVDAVRQRGGVEQIRVPRTGDEVERLATTMNDMLERLAAADASQRAFMSDASHELRSPLTTIRLLSEMDAPYSENADLIHTEAIRLQNLVDDLLLLTKAADGQLPLRLSELDCDDVVNAEVKRLRKLGHRVETSRLAPARLTADADKLTQVVRNLADNAARHATSAIRLGVGVDGFSSSAAVDGSSERQRHQTESGEETCVITVDNDGSPVPVEDREIIFDRFTRLAESRDRDSGGSGLGLAITAAIVEAHHGTVRACEAPDGWCRFEVRLPVAQS